MYKGPWFIILHNHSCMKGVSSVDRKEAGVKAGSDMVADQAVRPLDADHHTLSYRQQVCVRVSELCNNGEG